MSTLAWTLAVVASMAAASAPYLLSKPQPAASTLAYSYKVTTQDAFGSATVIGHVRYKVIGKPVTFSLLLTCAHVVNGAKYVKIMSGGKLYPTTVLAVDSKLDLAIVEVKQNWPAATLYSGKLHNGEAERITGAPIIFPVMVSGGYIGPLLPTRGGKQLRQGSASALPGNSGSGIYVYRDGWKMAGVLDAVANYSDDGIAKALAPNVSFFVPMSAVQKFLREKGFEAGK